MYAIRSYYAPADSDKPLIIEDYHWSEEMNKLLIFTNSKRVWRLKTRGDYWVLDMVSGQLRQLGGPAEPATLMFAKFSADGQQVAYVITSYSIHYTKLYELSFFVDFTVLWISLTKTISAAISHDTTTNGISGS